MGGEAEDSADVGCIKFYRCGGAEVGVAVAEGIEPACSVEICFGEFKENVEV